MPCRKHQNVSGTLKKITKLTQNVSGTLKPLTSLKQNVSGTLKEILAEDTVATFRVVSTTGVTYQPSTTTSQVNATSGWSQTFTGGQSATGVTGYTYMSSVSLSSFTVVKACTLSVSGSVTGNGSITTTINNVSYSTPFSKALAVGDSVSITANASWGYTTGGTYSMTVSLK